MDGRIKTICHCDGICGDHRGACGALVSGDADAEMVSHGFCESCGLFQVAYQRGKRAQFSERVEAGDLEGAARVFEDPERDGRGQGAKRNGKWHETLSALEDSLNGQDEWVAFLHGSLRGCATREEALEMLEGMKRDVSFAWGFIRRSGGVPPS